MKDFYEMKQKKIVALLLIFVFLSISLSACSGRNQTKSFMRDEVNLSYIQTVAVLPFENLGGGAGAAQRTREITMTQLLASGLFDVVDKGRVDSTLRAEAIEAGAPMDGPTMRRLGQRLGTQAFILGSVEQEAGARTGGAVYPEISLTLRLVDTETGMVLWQSSGRGSGYSLMDRLFGTTPKNSFEVTLTLVSRMLATIR